MAQKFVLELIKPDWHILKLIAEKNGYDRFKKMVPELLNETAGKIGKLNDCKCPERRVKNNFEIPLELQDFYNTLACTHSISVSAAIFRYTIMPKIISFEENFKPE